MSFQWYEANELLFFSSIIYAIMENPYVELLD